MIVNLRLLKFLKFKLSLYLFPQLVIKYTASGSALYYSLSLSVPSLNPSMINSISAMIRCGHYGNNIILFSFKNMTSLFLIRLKQRLRNLRKKLICSLKICLLRTMIHHQLDTTSLKSR